MIWRARENRSAVVQLFAVLGCTDAGPHHHWSGAGHKHLPLLFRQRARKSRTSLGAKALLLQDHADLLLSMAGFSLMYAAVPNCRVPFKHALTGGLFVAHGIPRSSAPRLHKLVVGSSYTFIYGAFAAVPLFLLWIYLSWNIVLMGGILVHSLSAYQE